MDIDDVINGIIKFWGNVVIEVMSFIFEAVGLDISKTGTGCCFGVIAMVIFCLVPYLIIIAISSN